MFVRWGPGPTDLGPRPHRFGWASAPPGMLAEDPKLRDDEASDRGARRSGNPGRRASRAYPTFQPRTEGAQRQEDPGEIARRAVVAEQDQHRRHGEDARRLAR